MNNFSIKSLIIPLVVLGAVGGAVVLGVFLSKSAEEPVATVLGSSIDAITDNRLGNPEATVELIEYADFQCPACQTYDPMIKKLMEEHGDWINFAYRHLPLKEIHPNAVASARSAEAAGVQAKFWEYKELLYTRQNEWKDLIDPSATFLKYAVELGLNEEQFVRDVDSDPVKTKVESQYQTAIANGLNSTPSFVVNGTKISNVGTYENLVQQLQAARQQ